ncbi:MAG: hypothetical protein ACYDEA_09420 [Candidatus Dormibacteria bacterium]
MAPHIKHPGPEVRPEHRYGFSLSDPDQAAWLDQVLGGVRLQGTPGVGVSAVVRLALSRLQGEGIDQVVTDLIRLREAGQDH